ncbi:MAG: aldehyde dehydrogenase [Chitinophagales bacterium]
MGEGIERTLERQREFFNSQKTRDIDFRINMLKKLKSAIEKKEKKVLDALHHDLHKSEFEGYMIEIGGVYEELHLHIKNLKKWARPERVGTGVKGFPGKSFIIREPYGMALIIAPWNYPFQLLMQPLVGSIAAGNCTVLKPAHYSEATSEVISELISDTFPPEYISVFKGGREVIKGLLQQPYDTIFFTGSPTLGKIVMEAAAKNPTPVTLELGGKSPCIVHSDVNVALAAKRVAWGKFVNAGQTCICPDYLMVHASIKDQFLKAMKTAIRELYGEDPSVSLDYGRIINMDQYARLVNLLNGEKIYLGGQCNPAERYIAPTLLTDVSRESEVMKEEIFGPIFPVLTYTSINEVIDFVNSRPKPLALYLFSNNNGVQNEVLAKTSFGGGCINDTLVHAGNPNLPFGGVGFSGMGSYHGKATFETFSHRKSILNKSTLIDMKMRYAPYTAKNLAMIRKLVH